VVVPVYDEHFWHANAPQFQDHLQLVQCPWVRSIAALLAPPRGTGIELGAPFIVESRPGLFRGRPYRALIEQTRRPDKLFDIFYGGCYAVHRRS
jgi:hypothetical protein